VKKLIAILCLALLPGLFACGAEEQPQEPLAGLRAEGYDYPYSDGDSPVRAFAAGGYDFLYEEAGGGIEVFITIPPDEEDENLEIKLPAYVDGKPLLGGFLKNMACRELRVPETMLDLVLSTSWVDTIVIPRGLESISFDRADYKTAFVDPDNPFLGEIDGVLINKVRATLIRYPFLRGGKIRYTVPDGITGLEAWAFRNVHTEAELIEIVIPPAVTAFPDDYESLNFTTAIVAAPGSAAQAYVNECNADGRQLKLALRDFE